MDLSSYLSAERGRAAALARALGVKPVVISRWASGLKAVPIERCLPVERATQGLVRRQDLRPEDWLDVWPELRSAATTNFPKNGHELAFLSDELQPLSRDDLKANALMLRRQILGEGGQ